MSILTKIKNWRASHKIASAIIDGAAAYTAINIGALALEELTKTSTPIIQPAQADYFDGCRGPNMFQLDQRLTLPKEGADNYTLLPKVFVDGDKDGAGLFGVAPLSYTPDNKPVVGAGIGGFFELGGINFLGVVPVVYNSQGEVLNLNPTLYATLMAGRFLFDAQINYLASTTEQETTQTLNAGTTIGFMMDNVIVGGEVQTSINLEDAHASQLEDNLTYQGIVRVDLDAQHKNWLQTYISKDAIGIGFRSNFEF